MATIGESRANPSVLILNGSGRRNGNTARTLALLRDAIERRLPDVSVDAHTIDEFDIKACIGCRRCFAKGERSCPHNDEIALVDQTICAADVVVLATPVYVSDVSGTMKTMIDRLAYRCHRPAFYRQGAFVLATTGGSPARHTLRTLQGAWLSWGGRLVGSLGVRTGALMDPQEIARRHGRLIDAAAERIARFITTHEIERPSFLTSMMFRIQQRNWQAGTPGTLDHAYWSGEGGFPADARYFVPQHGRPLRRGAGRAVGSLIARIVG